MTCGQNARDKTRIPGSIRGRGCGEKFDWNNRIRLETANSQEQSSCSGFGSAHAQTPQIRRAADQQGLAQVAAQTAQDRLTLEEQRARAGIIRIEANDPRVRDFPEFAALGDMVRVGNLLLSGVAPQRMNYRDANHFCRNLDGGGGDWLGQRQAGRARAPTLAEWRLIRQAIRRGTLAGYNPGLIPGMDNGWFWLSSPYGIINAGVFNGSFGWVGWTGRCDRHWVRCVRSVEW